jgi:hypothetical protein
MKYFLIILSSGLLISCFKQNPKPKNGYCACGRVEEKSIIATSETGTTGEYLYSITLRNRCTGNYKTFDVSKEEYITAKEKKDWCVLSEVNGW